MYNPLRLTLAALSLGLVSPALAQQAPPATLPLSAGDTVTCTQARSPRSCTMDNISDFVAADATSTGTGSLVRATGPTMTLPNATGLPISGGTTGNLPLGSRVSGTLPVANGGTGAASVAANLVFAGPNGSSGAPAFRSLVNTDLPTVSLTSGVSGILPAANGGTGVATAVANRFLASPNGSTGALSPRAIVSADLPAIPLTSGVSGVLPVANGGTGAATGAANLFLATPSGSSGAPSFRALTPADFPNVPPGPNLAPNSQWEIASGWSYGTAVNYQGTGTEGQIASSAYTTGTPGRTTFTVAATNDLSVGDLISAVGSGISVCLNVSPMRILAMVANTSITVRVPLGCSPSSSVATTLTPVVGGAYSATTTGSGPDGWTKTSTMPMWVNYPRGPYAANVPSNVGALASLGMIKDISGQEAFYIVVPVSQLANYRGHTITFGIYGMQKVAGGGGTWQVFSNDSVNGQRGGCNPAPLNAGSWQWLECTYAVPASTTYLYIGVILQGALADSYYFVNPVLTLGTSIGGVQNYVRPRSETLVPTVHISPYGWINTAVTFPATAPSFCNGSLCIERDFYAETGGNVAPSVCKARGQLEGINTGAVVAGSGSVRVMAWFDRWGVPQKSGSFLPQYVANVKSFMFMDFPLDLTDNTAPNQGTGVYVTNVASDSWSNISEELDEFLLNCSLG